MYQSEATLHQFHPNAPAFPIVLHNVYEHVVERSLDVNKDSWVVAAAMELKALITIQ